MLQKKTKFLTVLVGISIFMSGAVLVHAKKSKKKLGNEFFIYQDSGSRANHFIPSGWMGDFGDIKLNQGWSKKTAKPSKKLTKKERAVAKKKKKNTCMQIKYTAERKQGAGWAGVYWQHPANNWGDKRGGFDLSQYSKMVFWAKGETGGEVVDKFFIGGISGQTEEGDTDEASLSLVELSKKWERYEIDLKGLDLSHIIGGFGFAANADANPDGFTMYVDEVKLVK